MPKCGHDNETGQSRHHHPRGARGSQSYHSLRERQQDRRFNLNDEMIYATRARLLSNASKDACRAILNYVKR
jgi:hypothetical protein